jgi:5-carboxymethyl-2-hydroxymuconate isomerase
MPHLTLEYSNNLPTPVDFPALFGRLHSALSEFPRIKLGDIKSRAVPCNIYHIGSGDPASTFVHLTVKILTGRTIEERQKMSETMLFILSEGLAALNGHPCDITVDICEMERGSYGKRVISAT